MKKFVFVFLFLSNYANGACNTGAIGYVRESGFSISFGGGSSKTSYGDSTAINVPLTINGQQACYREKSKFTLKAEDRNNLDNSKIIISPVKAEFENVPEGNVKQYLFVEKSTDNRGTKFYRMTFICSGELPLSYDANVENYMQVLFQTGPTDVSTTMVFATGAAAENLNKNKTLAPEVKETTDFFSNLYKEKSKKELEYMPCCQKIPSILTASSVSAMGALEKSIVSKFTTMNDRIPNGCSKDFSQSMSEFLLENYEQNSSLKDFSVKKKWFSDDLIFEFKN